MLLPAFGDPRLTGKQGAEILKRSPLGRHYEQRRCNGRRCGSPPPPTPKRNCYSFAQRHTATPCDRPAAGWRQRDGFFYGPINLAKVLTLDGAQAPNTAPGRALCLPAGVSSKSIDWPTDSTAANRKQKLTISQALLANIVGKIFHEPACSLPSCHRQLPAKPHCFSACASQLLSCCAFSIAACTGKIAGFPLRSITCRRA